MYPELGRFPAITLDRMDSIRLMNRIDTKFVTDASMLEEILHEAEGAYMVLEADGERLCGYDSLYFDTGGLEMYTRHHDARLVRKKVRTRCYLTSGDTYLEVKRKNNHRRTKKKRMLIPSEMFGDFSSSAEACSFLEDVSFYKVSELHPRLNTSFKRITLVNNGMTERLTIDTHLSFHNHDTGRDASLKNAVIIELKQDGNSPSEMKRILRELRVKPFSISKYCIGNVLTDPEIKANRFKTKVRYVERIINDKLI